MNKKYISKTNPHGVDFPAAVTADGKIVFAIHLEKNQDDCKVVHYYTPGYEGVDDEEMVFIQLTHRNGVTKYFRHKKGYKGEMKNPDRYLHNYAKKRLKERFDESKKTGEFIVKYYVMEKCPYDKCKLRSKIRCQYEPKVSLTNLNLREKYDTCEIEKKEDKYIADLLLTNSKNPSVKPLFLEVFVTHECSDEKKNSGYPIIEIKTNKDVDVEKEIIENAGELVDEYKFMNPENLPYEPPIKFFGFERSIPFTHYKQMENFLLIKKEDKLIADCRQITCKEVNEDVLEKCVFSLTIPKDELKGKEIYEMGMAKAYELGFKPRDCTLCKQYKPSNLNTHPCRLNKEYQWMDGKGNYIRVLYPYTFQMPYRCNGFDKTLYAANCRSYSIDELRVSELVSMLNNKPYKVWVDDRSLPSKQGVHTNTYKDGIKLLTPQECHNCPIYRSRCEHCLGNEMKDEKRFVVCNWEKPQ